ncbi:MAG: exodeoxyribonuclease VII small subunit [bacterium]
MPKTELSFEEAIKKLEDIVKYLENDTLDLENSLKIFEEGIKLSGICNQKLAEAERKIEILLNKNNKNEPVPFKI